MVNDNLKILRATVRKRRSAVTAKENRIKRNTGVDIRGTEQDPRRPINVVDRYNRKQLLTYLGDLNRFMARSSGYVMGANGSALPKNAWEEYKNLESKYNTIGSMHFQQISDIFIPQAGMTILQRDQTLRPDSITAQGDIVNRPYIPIDRKPTNIKDADALLKLTKELKGKLHKSYLPSQLAAARDQLSKMLKTLGNADLNTKAAGLTDSQFDVLWNYTNFATNVSGKYFVLQSQATGSSDRWYNSVVEDYASDINELLDWAGTLEKHGTVKNGVIDLGEMNSTRL